MDLPKREGTHTRSELPLPDSPGYQIATFAKAVRLLDLTQEFVLFTHAPLFTHGNWLHDPVFDYFVECNPIHVPFQINLPRRLFLGLEIRQGRRLINDDWNYRLLAIHKDGWEDFFRFMGQVGGINRDDKRYHTLLAQQMPVPDILLLEHKAILPSPCPMVDIITFGLDGNDRQVYFAPALNPPIDKPKACTGPPDPKVVATAERVFAGQEKPFLPFDLRLGGIRRSEAEAAMAPLPGLLTEGT